MSYSQNYHDPEWYSDADVRADEKLQEMAIEYAENFEGKFPPVIALRNWLDTERKAPSTSMLRKVVNTMRHDDEWKAKMPVPSRFKETSKDKKKKKKDRNPENAAKDCDDCKAGIPHYAFFVSYELGSCPGIEWPINRAEQVRMPLRLKPAYKYVKARTGSYVHAVSDWNYKKPVVTWHPNWHAWGFGQPDWNIPTACKYPSWIRNGVLLTSRQVREMNVREVDPIALCPHCWPTGVTA